MPSVGSLGLSLYQALWAYDGWNLLNYISEEIQNPGRNLPLALTISMTLVTCLYILTNMAYLSILGPIQLLGLWF